MEITAEIINEFWEGRQERAGAAVVCEVQLKISELTFILNAIAMDFEVSQAHIEVL